MSITSKLEKAAAKETCWVEAVALICEVIEEIAELEAENKRLKKEKVIEKNAAQKLCQIYFEIAEEFISEEEIRKRRDQALKGKPCEATNPTCKKCKYETIPCEWKGERPCSAFTPKPSREGE